MKLLVTAWPVGSREGRVYVVDLSRGRTTLALKHDVQLRGMVEFEGAPHVAAVDGTIYRLTRSGKVFDLREVARVPGVAKPDVHDLYLDRGRLAAVCTGVESCCVFGPDGVTWTAPLGKDERHLNSRLVTSKGVVYEGIFTLEGRRPTETWTEWRLRVPDDRAGGVALVKDGVRHCVNGGRCVHSLRELPGGRLAWCDTMRHAVVIGVAAGTEAVPMFGLPRGLRKLSDGRIAVGLTASRYPDVVGGAVGVQMLDGATGRTVGCVAWRSEMEVYDVLEWKP